jgi:hypothetical protein
VAHPNKNKGDRAEREAAQLLADGTGKPARRKLGAGRADDTGDIDGVDNWTIQVKNRKDIARTIREGMPQLEQQRINNKTDNAAMLMRQHGGTWIVVITLDQYINLIK